MCIQFGSAFASRVLHREALPLRDAAASGPDGVTLLGIDHFSATKLVDYAWSLLLTRAAADDLRSWSNDLLLMAVCDHFVHRYSRTCTRALHHPGGAEGARYTGKNFLNIFGPKA